MDVSSLQSVMENTLFTCDGILFVWANDFDTYTVLESKVKLRVYKNFEERGGVRMKGVGDWSTEGLRDELLLCARGNGFVLFKD